MKPCGKVVCGPCNICGEATTNLRFTHLSSMKTETLKATIKSRCPHLKESDCICNACRIKYSKKAKDASYTPEKKKVQSTTVCFLSHYELCTDSGVVQASLNLAEFNETFCLECDSIPETISLCKKHRATLSNYKSMFICAICKSVIRGKEKKYSSMTLPDYAVEKLQQLATDFVTGDDYICTSCHRYSMRKNVKATLDDLDVQLKREIKDLAEVVDPLTVDVKAVKLTLQELLDLCRKELGFLIPDAYDIYVSMLQKLSINELQYQQAKRSKSWLKCKILDFFGDVVSISKFSSRKGDFIYVSNLTKDEIIRAWHESKCSNRSECMKNRNEDDENVSYDTPQVHVSVEAKDMKWNEFLFNINHLLRSKGKETAELFSHDPSSVLKFDFANMKSHLNPLVWNMVCALTGNREELTHLHNSIARFDKDFLCFPNNSSQGYVKRNRRIVLVFLLQYVLNENNSYPFHVIMANCIKDLSHSSRLMNIMNKLGFCCSEPTLERFLQGLKDVRQISGPLVDLSPSSFTIVSIDNIDVLAPYAAVTADKPRSWHGTSIMAQQPKPSSEVVADMPSTTEPSVPFKLPNISFDKPVLEKRPNVRKRLQPYSIESQEVPSKSDFEPPKYKTFIRNQVKEEQFLVSEKEQECITKLNVSLFSYVCERFVFLSDNTNVNVPGIKLKLAMEEVNMDTIKSKSSYLYILDEKADCPATLKRCLGILYDVFQVKNETNHLVIAGDAATVKLLMNIKKEYGQSLDWVLPYLGDWHILKNFHEVLMKIYWDSGLKEIAKLSHKHITLNSLMTCSNFKRTHRFFLQVYEAIYMLQYQTFLDYRKGQETSTTNENFLEKVKTVVSCLKYENGEISGMCEYRIAVNHLKAGMSEIRQEFDEFCETMAQKHSTFKFWDQFLKKDCFCYLSLWLAIRSGNWDLRLAALKEMVSLFHAFDRYNYAQLIPLHLNMINGLPDYIISDFKNGAFVNSISGIPFSSVAFDEAHEMKINKDCKMSISRSLPQPQSMDKVAATIQYRGQLVSNLETQIGSQRKNMLYRDMQPSVVKSEFGNVKLYYDKVSQTSVFSVDQPNNLFHIFSRETANSQQEKSLLNFRQIGQESYESYYKIQILHDTSVNKPVIRKFNLKTFAKEKVRRRRVSDLEKEKRLITLCYKRTISMSEERKQPISSLLQFVPVPRAICSPDGLPRKGSKAVIYDFFQKRYTSDSQIVSTTYSSSVSDTCMVVEGMNIIYMSPLKQHNFFIEYANMLVSRWITPFFTKGFKEVRILFDQAGTQGLSPKGIERKRRDKTNEDTEIYENIDDNTPLPKHWGNFLKVRTNKHALIRFLSRHFVSSAQSQLQNNSQMFITSGGFNVGLETNVEYSGAVVTKQSINRHTIQHNHEESDTQIWLHVFDSPCSNILIYSVDRDISMIGLALEFGNKEVSVQYCAKAGNNKYLQLKNLQSALKRDSDLAQLITKGIDITKCIQVLYICSGCDFVSFFAHFGKTLFFKVFFQYARFITGDLGNSTPGHLNQTSVPTDYEVGLLSFYRLILCVYFNANRACLNKFSNPIELFDSINADSPLEHHHKALDVVRRASWKGVYEDELMPSNSALKFHWKRSCWVSTVWGEALKPTFMYPDISLYGYNVSNHAGEIQVDVVWDTEENIERVKNNILYLTRGCSCKKNKCINRQCKCKKENNVCGPGCRCKSCENTPNAEISVSSSLDKALSDSEDSEDEQTEDSETEETDLNVDSDSEEEYVVSPILETEELDNQEID